MDTDRVEAFSDGVFAFAITVLVLAIAVPEAGARLSPALLHLWPSYLAYLMSFVVIGAIWINHDAMFRHIARVDSWVLILNLGQLLFIAFPPFPTAVLAQAFLTNVDESTATAFYGGPLRRSGCSSGSRGPTPPAGTSSSTTGSRRRRRAGSGAAT